MCTLQGTSTYPHPRYAWRITFRLSQRGIWTPPRRVNILRYIKKSIPTYCWICLCFFISTSMISWMLRIMKCMNRYHYPREKCFKQRVFCGVWKLILDGYPPLQDYQLKPLKLPTMGRLFRPIFRSKLLILGEGYSPICTLKNSRLEPKNHPIEKDDHLQQKSP